MIPPSIPENEIERLDALRSIGILDTEPEEEFDNITRLAAWICQVPESLISLLDARRQWFKSKVQLEACETSREVSFCGHAINNQQDEIFVIEDAQADQRFADNPLVTGDPRIRFYAGVPLLDDRGYALGTLCIIDQQPRKLSSDQLQGLRTLARNVSALMQLRKRNKELVSVREYTLRSLTHASPYLLIINRDGVILEIGDNFSLSLPGIQMGSRFDEFFTWDSLSPEDIFRPNFKGNTIFYFLAKGRQQRYKCSIRLFSPDSYVVFANPVVNDQFPLVNYHVNVSHFPSQDYFSEFLFIQDSAVKGLSEMVEMNERLSVKNKELRRIREELEMAKFSLEERVEERNRKVTHLAYFPQHNPNPVIEIDLNRKILSYVNPAAGRFFSVAVDSEADDFIERIGLDKQDIQSGKSKKQQFESEGKYLEVNMFFVPDSDILHLYFHDLTEIRNAQKEAEKNRLDFIRQQDVLLEIRSLPSTLDFSERLRLISRRALSILGSQRSSIWFYTDENKSAIRTEAVFLKDSVSFSEPIILNRTDFPGYFDAVAVQHEIVAEDAVHHPATREFAEVYLKPLGICSMLDVPIRRQNEVFGVLCSEYTGTMLKTWTESEIAFANSIADAVSLAYETEQLKISRKNLEDKTHSLEETMNQLVNMQGDLIRQEKLATLGMLIAGIAHEINTPLGAIKASNQTVSDTLQNELFSSLVAMKQEDFRLSLELFRLYRPSGTQLSTREERSLLKDLEEKLSLKYQHLQQPSRFARIILELGYQDLDSVLEPFLSMKENRDIFHFTVSLVRMNKSVNTIGIAVDKAARVVKALNNFSHGNLDQIMGDFHLHDNLESVITILWNKIKGGSTVKLDVSKDAILYGNQEELGQVWTNLINNALQASGNKCNIHIRHWIAGNWHHITFSNDGPPIPAAILPKIFDAFFTTKKHGEGTGLGLNISRQIIEKNGGSIKVASRPSETIFEIFLPVNR